MILDQKNGLEFYRFESFDNKLISHGIFTRKGGVSPSPWSSLNQGGTVGDARENVIENRRRAFAAFGRPVESIYDVWQVHGNDVVYTSKPRPLESDHIKADAIITNNPAVTLFMRFADCVPILIYDPARRIVGIIHAGWMGTVNKIVLHTLQTLRENYHCDLSTLVTGIGPSIGVCHYQIGDEVVNAVRASFGTDADNLLIHKEDKVFFDLWKANEHLLRNAGVNSVEVAGLCTACHTEHWYSHRGEAGKTGRFGAMIFLNEGSEDGRGNS